MKKKIFIIVIAALIFFTGIIVYFVLNSSQPQTPTSSVSKKETQENLPPAGTESIPNQKAQSQTVLFLFPNPITFSRSNASESAKVFVQIDTQENKITTVQLELSYDPRAVSLVSVEPGATSDSFFSNPSVLLSLNNSENGILLYSLQNPTASSGQATVATLTFVKNPNATTSAPLRFLGKTTATGPNSSDSLLKLTQGATFIFE